MRTASAQAQPAGTASAGAAPGAVAACRLGHDVGVEDLETVEFALDGGRYEIDLCREHADVLRDDIEHYVGAGRPSAPPRRAS